MMRLYVGFFGIRLLWGPASENTPRLPLCLAFSEDPVVWDCFFFKDVKIDYGLLHGHVSDQKRSPR